MYLTNQLSQTIDGAISHLDKILSNHDQIKTNLAEFYDYLDLNEVKKYLFVNSSHEEVETGSSEIFGVYKFFPNIGQYLQSNYCEISVRGVHLTVEGLKNPVQFKLRNLIDSNIVIRYHDTSLPDTSLTDTSLTDTYQIAVTEILREVTILRDHYKEILAFL